MMYHSIEAWLFIDICFSLIVEIKNKLDQITDKSLQKT